MTAISSRSRTIAGNTATGLLKILALIFMMIDHLGASVFPGVGELRMIGRLAFPIYCWCMVVGFCYTRSVPRYLLRLGLIGLISQPLYMVALNHPLNVPNIFLTLLLGLCGLWGIRERKLLSHIWAPVLAMVAAVAFQCSYGWPGVLLILVLYACRTSRPAIASVMIVFCLYWGVSSAAVYEIGPLNLQPLRSWKYYGLISPFLKLQAMALLSLPLILIRMPWKVRMPAWLGYALYPLHLAALILIQYLMGRQVRVEHLMNGWETISAAFAGLTASGWHYLTHPMEGLAALWGWITGSVTDAGAFLASLLK